jgi:F-type H+-transporting ATPase subunit gamma
VESLDRLQKQLDSLGDLRSIVRTMKALSAASIRQYERAVIALGAYYDTIERGLHVALRDMDAGHVAPAPDRKPLRLAAVVFGSDHGLCGRFNEEIAEYAAARMDSTPTARHDRTVLAVGARIAANLEHGGQPVEDVFFLPGSAEQITLTVQQLLVKIDDWQHEAGIHYVYLFYNGHAGGKTYRPTGIELLPINLRRFHRLGEERWPSRSLPTFSMDRDVLIARLLRQYLFVSLFRACAESQASEHASRLSAMQSAERNLDDRLVELTAAFRRARQDSITAELLDVVSGYEAITQPAPGHPVDRRAD